MLQNIKTKLVAGGILVGSSVLAMAEEAVDHSALLDDIDAGVSTFTTIGTALLGLSVGVFLVGMGIRWARKATR